MKNLREFRLLMSVDDGRDRTPEESRVLLIEVLKLGVDSALAGCGHFDIGVDYVRDLPSPPVAAPLNAAEVSYVPAGQHPDGRPFYLRIDWDARTCESVMLDADPPVVVEREGGTG